MDRAVLISVGSLSAFSFEGGYDPTARGELGPRSDRVSVDQDACIETTFGGASIRVRGVVDAQALSVVLECLARRA